MTPAKAISRVALYARVSTKRQADEGMSLVEQRLRLEGLARSRKWEVVATYMDAASGRDLSRPEMRKLLGDAQAGKFDAVLALDLSRISRDVTDWGSVRKLLRTYGVTVKLLDGDFDDSPSGVLLSNIVASVGQYTREAQAARTRAALQMRQSQRLAYNREAPFGFKLSADGKRLLPDADELRGLRLMAEWRKHGGSLREIGRRLEASEIMPRHTGHWHPQVVAHVLRNLQPDGTYARMGVRL
jgi:site-specific DNA recombinase